MNKIISTKREIMTKTKQMIFIAGSAGSLVPLRNLLTSLPANFTIPIFIVLHLAKNGEKILNEGFSHITKLQVQDIYDKQDISNGVIYLAPGDYHTLVEKDYSFSLCVDEKVNHSKPSIDVSLASAALIYKSNLLAILLSGSNIDGAQGAKEVKANGGLIWVQDPAEAEFAQMPESIIETQPVDYVGTSQELCTKLFSTQRFYNEK